MIVLMPYVVARAWRSAGDASSGRAERYKREGRSRGGDLGRSELIVLPTSRKLRMDLKGQVGIWNVLAEDIYDQIWQSQERKAADASRRIEGTRRKRQSVHDFLCSLRKSMVHICEA